MNISDKIKYIGVDDTTLDLFESQYIVPNGVSYNSYLILDEKDFIEDSYVLEVSSPGLGRPLKKEKDYKRNLGKEVEIRTYRMVDKKKEFTGLLDSYDYEAGTVTIELEDGTMKTFEKGDIALIRLAFDF